MNRLVFLVLMAALSAPAQLIPGDLAVLRIGDGSATLTSASTAGFVDLYTTAAGQLGPVSTTAIPSTGGSALTWSGSATSEGALGLSADGTLLTFAGYNVAKGTASIASTTSASVSRGVGTVNLAGTYALGATTATQFSGNNIRSGASDGAGNYWGAGANSGTYYLGTASAAATVQSTLANTRVLEILGGNLYFSTSSGSSRGIYGFTGMPTSAAAPSYVINTGSSSSPYAYAFNPAGTVAYIADDSSIASGGGIQKWVLSGGSWSLSYTLGTGTGSTAGARGLAADFSGAAPVLYATTAESSGVNRLIEITDTGSGSLASTLATASANEVFRGVVLVPEPTGLLGVGALLLLLARKFLRGRK